VLRAFPVDLGSAPRFSDDYGKPRAGRRTHEGIDIFAPEGAPVLAVDDGSLRFDTGELGGMTAYVTATDGARYYYAHLSRWEGQAPRKVKAGDVIGYVGHTGNALHTEPHLHFEIHPTGTHDTVDPFPDLTTAFHAPFGVLPPEARKPAPRSPGGGLVLLALIYLASRR
jgi:murein DD-endopeptidase MepM/ murein hydrolase activator NlpD